jgi:superfamily I DNA and/or RNA helicase
MIVCSANHAVDLLLDKLAVIADKISIVRLGTSMNRDDLNRKYALEATKKNDAIAYTRVQDRMDRAKILVTGTFSLRQHALEKSPLLFDTVIFDDASLINETDCLSALSHGANRAIFLGNRVLN